MALSLYRGGGQVMALGSGGGGVGGVLPWSARDDPFLHGMAGLGGASASSSALVVVAAGPENQISVVDLRRLMRGRDEAKRKAYVAALDRCYARVRRCASVGRSECTYVVPRVIVGLPLYDHLRCAAYVVSSLRRNGFVVDAVGADDPTVVLVGWAEREGDAAATAPEAAGDTTSSSEEEDVGGVRNAKGKAGARRRAAEAEEGRRKAKEKKKKKAGKKGGGGDPSAEYEREYERMLHMRSHQQMLHEMHQTPAMQQPPMQQQQQQQQQQPTVRMLDIGDGESWPQRQHAHPSFFQEQEMGPSMLAVARSAREDERVLDRPPSRQAWTSAAPSQAFPAVASWHGFEESLGVLRSRGVPLASASRRGLPGNQLQLMPPPPLQGGSQQQQQQQQQRRPLSISAFRPNTLFRLS